MLARAAVWTCGALLVGSVAAGASGFPLVVGNWWRYQATFGGVPVDTDSTTLTLTVSDSLRLDLTRIDSVSALSPGDLPRASTGELYYVLEGSLTDVVLTMRHTDCDGVRRNPTTALLVSDYLPRPDGRVPPDEYPRPWSADMLWLSGVRVGETWLVFSRDQLMWDLSPGQFPGSLWRVDGCLFTDTFNERPEQALVAVPAGTFPASTVIWVQSSTTPAGAQLDYYVHYSPDVGIARIAQFELVEASVNGLHYPISSEVAPSTWGTLKRKGGPD